uniref:RHS repeat-associated core domain-containing protein n=1 Tax=Pseudomonas sp. TH41 TaxID=2796405 RepID=UPI001F5B8803|nr:RHS repeat-associated core domain-containing protein [Pseudomonas sp. TH41]
MPTHQRFYCKSRLATEIQGAMQHSIFQYGDQLLAQQQRQGDGGDSTLLATNQQRSVMQALKANNERRAIAYSPYGHRPNESGFLSLVSFNGERRDPVTGHYLLGHGYRAFNPVLMRFNSPDSWSPFGRGGLNPYVYCAGDPVNKIDPSGHAKVGLFGVVMVKVHIRKWRLNGILDRLSYPPHQNLTPEKALALAERRQDVMNGFKALVSHQAAVFKFDYDNRLSPNLKNIAAGSVSRHELPLDNLPVALQNFAKTPHRPTNSAKLLETLMESTSRNGKYSFLYELAMSEPIIDRNGVEIPSNIKKGYFERIDHTVSAARQILYDENVRIGQEIRGINEFD